MHLDLLVTNLIRFLIEGLAVGLAASLVMGKKVSLREVIMIGLTAAASFAVLDLMAPEVSSSARQGAGLGIGAGMVGFQPRMPFLVPHA